ncbi:MAG: glycoside hydrolase family 5 protein [Tannerellaceae bacterium]|nr:glycoside hydrolase family 5 protein [Tannerellaceae bacterium]
MKRLWLPFILLFICGVLQGAEPVKMWGKLQVKGNQLCSEAGEPITLRGVSYGWHNLWPRFYNKHTVKWLKNDWHCTVLRAAMGTVIEDNYIENPEFALECMNKVIKAAIKNNLYVIIDWHTYYPQKEEAKAFFGRMAQKYGKYPNIIYEIYNEPMEDTWDSVKEYAREVISEIRKYDPDNIVLVGSPHWDQDLHLVAESPLEGFDNIMYTLHFYAATHSQELRDRAQAAWEKGIPIFVSECAGMEASGDGPLNMEEWQRWIDWMEQHKMSWVKWSLSDKNETCSMLIPRAHKNGGWTDDVIKIYGRHVRRFVRQYNQDIFDKK